MLDSIRITARDAAIILLVIENLVVSAGILFILIKVAGLLKQAKPKTENVIRKAAALAIQVNQMVTNTSMHIVAPIAQYRGIKVAVRSSVRRLLLGKRKEAPGV